jgi:hypothetical protein
MVAFLSSPIPKESGISAVIKVPSPALPDMLIGLGPHLHLATKSLASQHCIYVGPQDCIQ